MSNSNFTRSRIIWFLMAPRIVSTCLKSDVFHSMALNDKKGIREMNRVHCFVLYSSVQFNIALKSRQKLLFAREDPKQSCALNFKDHLISVQLSCSIYHSRSDTPKLPSVHSSEGKGRVLDVLNRLWCIPLGRSNISRLVWVPSLCLCFWLHLLLTAGLLSSSIYITMFSSVSHNLPATV